MQTNRLNLRNAVAIAICLVVTTMVSSCDEEKFVDIDNKEFCLCANLEDFYKTAPTINAYLERLTNDWSDEQKLQALTEWLNSKPCVINSKLEGVYTDRDCMIMCLPGRYGNISILLDDNGMTRELTLSIFGEYSKQLQATGYSYTKPKEVSVHFAHPNYRQYTDIISMHDVFDFIDLFDNKVLNIYKLGNGGQYISSMSKDNLDYIVNSLKAKPYFSRIHGYWDGQLCIDLVLNNMENTTYRTDWFQTMNDYKLIEITTVHGWFIIDFEVPDGKEKEWMEKFNTHEFVSGATFNSGFQSMIIQ